MFNGILPSALQAGRPRAPAGMAALHCRAALDQTAEAGCLHLATGGAGRAKVQTEININGGGQKCPPHTLLYKNLIPLTLR